MWILVLFVVIWSIILINEDKQRRDIMSAIDTLNTSVTNLQSEVTTAIAALQTLPNNDAAITTAATNIDAVTAQIKTAVASLTNPAV